MEQQPYDVAVLDCGGHEIAWLELSARVRQAHRHKRLPLVVLTQHAPETFHGSLSRPEDFARKPLNADEFAVKIMTAILKSRSEQQAAGV